jgi:hypothetical protein
MGADIVQFGRESTAESGVMLLDTVEWEVRDSVQYRKTGPFEGTIRFMDRKKNRFSSDHYPCTPFPLLYFSEIGRDY